MILISYKYLANNFKDSSMVLTILWTLYIAYKVYIERNFGILLKLLRITF